MYITNIISLYKKVYKSEKIVHNKTGAAYIVHVSVIKHEILQRCRGYGGWNALKGRGKCSVS